MDSGLQHGIVYDESRRQSERRADLASSVDPRLLGDGDEPCGETMVAERGPRPGEEGLTMADDVYETMAREFLIKQRQKTGVGYTDNMRPIVEDHLAAFAREVAARTWEEAARLAQEGLKVKWPEGIPRTLRARVEEARKG
jgi:hypothetical protein